MTDLVVYDRAEDLSADDLPRYFKQTMYEEEVVGKLKDQSTYLLDGCRGSGKTMLMRIAELQLDDAFRRGASQRMAVFVRFPRAIALEGSEDSADQSFHPFRQWVFSKLLKAILEKIQLLRPQHASSDLLIRVPEYPENITSAKLGEYIGQLETVYRDNAASSLDHNVRTLGLSLQWLRRVDKPDEMRLLFVALARALNLNGFVFFLDEVAQNLSQEHQNEFFSIVKHLRDPRITCKVAVYPHITSYGPDFEAGHDAVTLGVERQVENDEYLGFFRDIVKQRTAGTALDKAFADHDEYLRLIVKACFGNPRALIHILARLPLRQTLQFHDVKNAVKEYVEEEHLKYLHNLKDRLRRFQHVIAVAEDALGLFLEDLKKVNSSPGPRCLFVAVSSQKSVPYRIHRALDILVYAGLLSRRGTAKITARESATRYLVNFGLLIKDNVVADPQGGKANLSVAEFLERLSEPDRDRKKEYTRSAPDLLELSRRSEEQEKLACTKCGRTVHAEDRFCAGCGSRLLQKPLYEELLAHPIDRLDLTPGVLRRLQEEGNFKTVGDVIAATDDELDSVPQIGKTRTRVIRYAAEEYVSA